MKFNVASKSLQQQLSSVSKVINSKNAMSILDNFLFRTEGNTLYITGSDSENVITASMEIYEPEGDGSVAVPAKKLMEILKEVSGQALTFYINDESHEVDIRFLNGHFNFMGVNAAEFPTRPVQADDALTFTVPANVITSGYCFASASVRSTCDNSSKNSHTISLKIGSGCICKSPL